MRVRHLVRALMGMRANSPDLEPKAIAPAALPGAASGGASNGPALRRRTDDQQYLLEPLEPRILLSGSPFYSAAGAAAGLSMTLDAVDRQGVQTLVLSDGQGSELASAALSALRGPVVIVGSSFDDTLHAEAGLDFRFDGGAGTDTLVGGQADTQWRIDGGNSGSLTADGVAAHFTGVEQLRGAADNRDLFTIAAGGSLSGGLDGGARGDDAMVFEATAVANALYEAFGPDSGQVVHGARVTPYAGLEPITDLSPVADRVFSASSAADNIVVTNNDDGTISIRSGSAVPTFESLTFLAEGTRSLTINSGPGADSLRVSLASATFSGGLTVNDSDFITLSDIQFNGNLTVAARNGIETTRGAVINAGSTGDVRLTVTDTYDITWGALITGFKDKFASADIVLDGATVLGRDITIAALASGSKLADVQTPLTKDTQAVLTADFNRDGKVDLVQANREDGEVLLYLNNGTASPFDGVASQVLGRSTMGSTLSDFKPTSMAAGDVDGDGDLDLLVGDETSKARLFLNTGASGTPFSTAAPVLLGTGVSSGVPLGRAVGVALADVSGDGRVDAIVTRTVGEVAAGVVEVLVNSGDGRTYFPGNFIGVPGPADDITAMAVGDVDNDGRADLVLGSKTLGTAYALGNGNGLGPVTRLGPAGESNTAVAIGGVNGNGRRDIIVGNSDGTTRVWFNTTSSGLVGTPGGQAVTAIAVGDVNADGRADLVLGRADRSSQVIVHNGQQGLAASSNPYSAAALSVGAPDSQRPVTSLALGDVNGDNRPDLVLGAARDVSLVFTNNSAAGPAGASPFIDSRTSLVNPDSSLVQRIDDGLIGGLAFNAFGSVVNAQSTSAVSLIGNTRVTASGNVDIQATSLASANQINAGVFVSYAAATIDSHALVRLSDSTTVQAGGQLSLKADTVNVLKQSVFGLSPGLFNFALAYGKLDTTAVTEVTSGVSLSAANVNVHAGALNTIATSASGFNLSITGDVAPPVAGGVSLAIGDYSSSALALAGGQITSPGSVKVDASSVNLDQSTLASSSLLNVAQGAKGLGSVPIIGNKISSYFSGVFSRSNSQNLGSFAEFNLTTPQVSISGAVTYAESRNLARAELSPNARVRAGVNLDVAAVAEDNIRAGATAAAGDSDTAALGGAVSVASTDNQAQAIVSDGVQADAGGLMHVVADARIPNPVRSTLPGFQYTPPADTTGAPNSAAGDRLLNGFNTTQAAVTGAVNDLLFTALPLFTGALLGDATAVGTSFTLGSGTPQEGGEFGLGGSVSVLGMANHSTAHVGRNVRINQGGVVPLASGQDVWVEALGTSIGIHLAGQTGLFALLGLKNAGAGVGIGGNVIVVTQDASARAIVDDSTVVSAARDVKVTANTLNQLVAVTAQGVNAGSIGLVGNVSFGDMDQLTQAWIEDGAVVNAGRDLQVRAGSTVHMVAADGSLAIGGSLGVGVAVGINTLRHDVRAFIGDNNNFRPAQAGSIQAGRDLDVGAVARQEMWSFGTAGSAATGEPKIETINEADMESSPKRFNDARLSDLKTNAQNAKWGYAASGAVAVNHVRGSVEAYVKTPGSVRVGGKAGVVADDQSLLIQGGGAFGIGRQGGIGGSAAALDFDRKTYAHVDNINWAGGALTVRADSDETIVSAAAGAAGASKLAAAAGSVTVHLLNSDTQAWIAPTPIGQANFDVAGALLVDAAHQRREHNVAGALSIGLNSQAAVGAAVAIELANTKVKAFVGPRVIANVEGNVTVQARNDEEINLVAASLAASPTSGVGFAGTIALQQATNDVQASFTGNLFASGHVRIDAADESDRLVIAGGAAGGKAAGIGLSFGASVLDRNVEARVGAGSVIGSTGNGSPQVDPQSGLAGSAGITVEATSQDDLVLVAAGGAGGGNAAVAASGAVQITKVRTEAVVGASGTRLETIGASGRSPGVTIRADDRRDALVIGGSLAAAQTGAVGAVGTLSLIDATTQAHVDSAAARPTSIRTSGQLTVDAATTDAQIGVAAGAAGGGQGAGAGSFSVVERKTTTQAWVGDTTTADVGGSARISADTDLSTTAAAGAGAIGGQGGVGASNATVLDTTVTRAFLGALTTMTVRGGPNSALSVASGQRGADGKRVLEPVAGLTVSATVREFMRPVAVGLGAGGRAGVAASVSFTQVDNFTHAFIDRGAVVTADQNVNLLATDDTDVLSVGGGVGAAGKVGVGAGADAGTVKKITRAFLANPDAAINAAPSITATQGDVRIRALSDDQLLSVAAAGGASGTVGVAGAASVWIVEEITQALINSNATVVANGDVQLAADAQTRISQIAGSVGAAGSVGVGASVAASTLTKDTAAVVGSGASITARGNGQAIEVADGSFEAAGGTVRRVITTPDSPLSSSLDLGFHRLADGQAVVYRSNGSAPIAGLADGQTYYVIRVNRFVRLALSAEDAVAGRFVQIGALPAGLHTVLPAGTIPLPAVSNTDVVAPNGSGKLDEILSRRSLAPVSDFNFNGLAVTATSLEAVEAFAASAGGGGSASVQIAGAGHRTQATTRAIVSDRVSINANNAGANANQSVRVLAADNSFHLGAGGSAGAAGSVAVSPGIDAVVIRNTTLASVGDGGVINARKDVEVQALAEENLLTFAVGLAGSGSAAVAGSLAGQWIDNRTQASLGSGAGSAFATVNAGGNAIVVARDDTRTGEIAGAGALGLGGGGFSAAIGLTSITKDTQAQIGRNAVVNALGNSSRTLSALVPGSDIVTSGLAVQNIFTGVQVAAHSSESTFAVGVAGSAGGYVGVAGGVTAQLVKSATAATVGDGARINQSNAGAAAGQSVFVTATNEVSTFAADGSVGLSVAGGVAGAVDVTVVRNDTSARIGSGAAVSAARDVEVDALARRDIVSKAASAAAASVGIGGSVSVVVIGSALDAQAQRTLQSNDGTSNSAAGPLDQETRGARITGALDGYTAPPEGDSADAARRMANLTAGLRGSLGITTGATAASVITGAATGGTKATIGSGAKVTAGRDLKLQAAESDAIDQLVGTATVGQAGAGGAVAVAQIASSVTARVDDVTAAPTVLSAAGNLNVIARQAQAHDGDAYAAAGGLYGALGAQVVVFSDDSDQVARIGDAVQVTRAGAVKVQATANRSIDGAAVGGAAGVVAATGSVVKVTLGGDTLASVGNFAQIGSGTGAAVGSLSVLAESRTQARAETKALAVSGAGGAGADSSNTITTVVRGWVDFGARVTTSGDVSVKADSYQDAVAKAGGGGFGGLQIGVNKASTLVTTTVLSELGNTAQVRAGGNVDFGVTAMVDGESAATSSGGALLGATGVTGASLLTQTAWARLGDGAVVRAGGKLAVTTDVGTRHEAKAMPEAVNFSSAGASEAGSLVNVTNGVRLGVGTATVSGGSTTLQAKSSESYTFRDGTSVSNRTPALLNAQAASPLQSRASVAVLVTQTTDVLLDQRASVLAGGDVNLSSDAAVDVDADGASPVRLLPVPAFGPVSVSTVVVNNKSVRVQQGAVVETPGNLNLTARGNTRVGNDIAGGLFGLGLDQTLGNRSDSTIRAEEGSSLAAARMQFWALGAATTERTGSTGGTVNQAGSSNERLVSMGGDLFKFGAQDRRLTVLADGTVAANSNMAATVAANGTVTVADLLPATDGSPLRLDVVASNWPANLVWTNNVLRAVNVTNASPGTLVMGRVNMSLANDNSAAPIVTYNGSPSLSAVSSNGEGTLNLAASGGGGMTLAGNIAARGNTRISTADFATAGQDIRVGAGVSVTNVAGNLVLLAGDNLNAGAASRIENSSTGLLILEVDNGNADAGVGATLDIALATEVRAQASASLRGGDDADVILTGVQALGTSFTGIFGNAGNDRVDIAYLDADQAFVLLGEGDDQVTFGRVVNASGQRSLSSIGSIGLRVEGGGGRDTLYLANSASTVATNATLSAGQFQGGGLGSAVLGFGGIEAVRYDMGSGADRFIVSAAGFSSILVDALRGGDKTLGLARLGAGADFQFQGGNGNDILVVGSPLQTVSGRMSNVQGSVSFQGGGGTDTLVLDDRLATVASASQIAANLVTGFSLAPAGVRMGQVEVLQMNLGQGDDRVNVAATAPGMQVRINGGPGNDTVTGQLTGVVVNPQADPAAGAAAAAAVDASAANAPVLIDGLVFDGEEGIDALVLDDSANTGATDLVITSRLITGTGIGAQGVGYARVENFDMQTGQGGSRIVVQSSVAGTTLALRGTAGNDELTLKPTAANIVYDAGAGDDVIRIADPEPRKGLTGKVTVIGGAGNDTLIGSSADDVLYGDGVDGEAAGDGDDVIIGGLGNDRIVAGGGNDVVFGDLGRIDASCDRVVVETLRDSSGGRDHISAGSGDDLVFGGADNDTIDAGDGRNIVFGDTGALCYRDGRIESLETTQAGRAGNDQLTAGSGDDVLLGGGGADRLNAGQGNNLLFADGGRLEWSRGKLAEIKSKDLSRRDVDRLVAGDGADILFGSHCNDQLDAGGGSNRVYADGGEIDGRRDQALIDWNTRFQASAITTGETSRQAKWLQRALAGGLGVSPFGVTGTVNAELTIDLATDGPAVA